MKSRWLGIFVLVITTVLGCTGVPKGLQPVSGFDADRYLGKWYEIARLDHSFERGLDSITAQYSLREDGGVRVINRGYSRAEEAWKQAEGKAFFVSSPDTGHLKVSFFGPFYGSYIVFELDQQEYQYAFVSGPDKSYLWLLARSPSVDPDLVERFVTRAGELGFAVEQLIYVEHPEGT